MIATKRLLALNALAISISLISITSADAWCGYDSISASERSSQLNVDCSANVPHGALNCMQRHVDSAATKCLADARGALNASPDNKAALQNYVNLSWYFYGVYDIDFMIHNAKYSRKGSMSSTNANIKMACTNGAYQSNMGICQNANYQIMSNPNFVPPTVTLPPPPPPAVSDCLNATTSNGKGLYNAYINNLKVKVVKDPSAKDELNTAVGKSIGFAAQCSPQGNAQSCGQLMQFICTKMNKTQLTHCGNPDAQNLITNCQ